MPWFKNSVVYEFTKPTYFTQHELEHALSTLLFRPCVGQELTHLGWISPYGDNDHEGYLVAQNDQFLLKTKKETKLLPTSVIKHALQTKIDQREQAEKRRLKKTEKAALKEEVITDLLPRAFSKYHCYFLWIDLKHQRVVVDCASHTQAEALVSLLRKCLGSLPLVPQTLPIAPEVLLTKWVKTNTAFASFQFGDEAELKDPLAGLGIIRCKQQTLICDEIAQHLNAGKQITKLKVVQKNHVHFILQNDLTLKRIKYDTALLDKNETLDTADTASRISADFFVMRSVLSDIFNQINEIFNILSVK